MHRFTSKELAFLAMLTCCNSVAELLVGGLLHLVDFSMKGSVLVGINLMVYTLLFKRIPRFGAITTCGCATVIVNFLLTGGFKIFALYCIFLEALVVDLLFCWRGLNNTNIIVAGMAASLTAGLCGLVNSIVFWGIDLNQAALKMAESPALVGHSLALILGVMLLWRLAVGAVFGFLATKVLQLLHPELSRLEGDSPDLTNRQEMR